MSDILRKKPKVLGARMAGLRLSQEERIVMARIDGELSVGELVGATGLAPERVEQIVSKLAFAGALELGSDPRLAAPLPLDPGASGPTSLGDFAAALGMDPSSFGEAPAPSSAPTSTDPTSADPASRPRKVVKIVRKRAPEPPPAPVELQPVDELPTLEPVADPDPAVPPMTSMAATPATAATPAMTATTARGRAHPNPDELPDMVELPELEPARVDDNESGALEAATEDGTDPGAAPDAAPDSTAGGSEDEDDTVSRAVAERNYRQLYEQRWHHLPADQRAHAAKTAHGMDLFALCFDPDARVIISLLENATVGLDHVRLIAIHHRTSTGLEMLARRQDWLRDLLVERRLLRNPMIGEIVLGRVMGPKRLFPTYKIAIDRDIPELSRIKCRGMIRTKWGTATSEERADLLARTEARCLILMTGCTFDAKTTAILCGRPINSAMFVQSVAKFAAAPPALLAHLIKQPFVRKNPGLKKLLLQHPNMPGDVKRSV